MLQAEQAAPANAGAPTPAVSILIPLYNSAATIERAVRSALDQTVRDIEVIVADDASTDDGAARVAALALTDTRIRLIRLPENRGKPAAMNIMVAQARGVWLAVLDADDAYAPSRLEVLLRGAEAAGTDMAADNIRYIDAGVPGPDGGGQLVRYGFDPVPGGRVLGKADLLRDTSSFASFDYGILKPVVRRDFIRAHRLAYNEASRLAEDFTYLLEYFVAGGRVFVASEPLYDWTMPFGAISRRWTNTGAGPWRYDYRPALAANQELIAKMTRLNQPEVVAMLQRRGRQYQVMVHYIEAQKKAAQGKWLAAVAGVLGHPSVFGLLARRVAGRIAATGARLARAKASQGA
jgi:succinoglycan biosynthesis protein ExoO